MRAFQRITVAALLGAYVVAAPGPVSAQDYPTKYVRIITAGSGTFHDIVTRHLAQRLGERWGQSVVVENQPAAGLTIGSVIAARSAPDGYTLLMADRSSLAVAPSLYKKLSYDPGKDFSPITLVARIPVILVSHPSVPASNLREFIDYAKQHPGAIDYAAAGPGTATHIPGELFKHMAGIDLTTVQYKGGAAAVTAILSGEVKVGFSSVSTILSHVRAGRLKAYAIASKKRFAGAPEIPTATEAGLPGFESEQWIGMLAPARTPAALVAKLDRDIVDILRTSAMQAALLAQGAEPAPGTPEEFAAFIKSETVNLRQVIERAGIRAE